MFIAQTTGCRVTGVDINESGITTARETAEMRGLQERTHEQSMRASPAIR